MSRTKRFNEQTQMWELIDSSPVPNISIEQTTGPSETHTMSQKAISDELKSKVSLPKGDFGKIGQTAVSDGKGGIIWMDREVTTWKDVQAAVQANLAPHLFPVGYEFTTVDSIDKQEITWVVRGHNHHKKKGAPTAPTMTLEMKHVYSGPSGSQQAIQFDASEALIYAETELAAGTYNFQVQSQAWFTSENGKYMQFTLSKPVPIGGQILLKSTYNQSMIGSKVETYSGATSTEIIETAIISEGNGGTALGATDGKSANVNHMHRVFFGSNNYAQSSLRQFLLSDKKKGEVWKPSSKFDRPPSWVNSQNGFQMGLPEDFLGALCEPVLPCRTNSVGECDSLDGSKFGLDQTYELNDRIFLLSRPEIYGDWDSSSIKDGEQLEFYKGLTDTERIKRDKAGTARWAWLRSPNPWYACYERDVDTGGSLSNDSAYYSIGAAAACVIG